jgi:NTE family protein
MPANAEQNNSQLKIQGKPGRAPTRLWCQTVVYGILLAFFSGCASYGIVDNEPIKVADTTEPYSLQTWATSQQADDIIFLLAFSGGGTRAAAMAFGVLQELRDTPIVLNGQQQRLLDKVTHISSVSGGSFTAAYYGLHGDRIFDTFESEFLRKDIEGDLTKSLFRPAHWFGSTGRTYRAIDYYNEILFHNASFADMMQPHLPMIIINSSDLGYGVRFSFIQDYFNFLCSDLLSFPVANAVTASSAVPVVFNPVVVENYGGCENVQFTENTIELAQQNQELSETISGLKSYSDKENRKYIHFVDGGITDNTGLRAITDVVNISGGISEMLNKNRRKTPRHVVFLSVNASTHQESTMGKTTEQPSIREVINAMTDVQLHRYNASTIDEAKASLDAWTRSMSTPEHSISSYFIQVSFEEVPEMQLKLFLNKIPTSFSLTDEQVDALISSGRNILRADPEFQRLIKDLGKN